MAESIGFCNRKACMLRKRFNQSLQTILRELIIGLISCRASSKSKPGKFITSPMLHHAT